MIYSVFFKVVLRWIPPEVTHSLAIISLRLVGLLPLGRRTLRKLTRVDDQRLRVTALGLTFPNPVGVAAGMDKHVKWFEELGALGFGFVEVGTVTAHPQKGSSKPRVWRLTRDRALVNAMGFPNDGAETSAERLRKKRTGETIVGTNIGKSLSTPVDAALDDYRTTARAMAPVSDFLVLNVSSPNTPDLQTLQAVEPLRALVEGVRDELALIEVQLPILVKISADLPDADIDQVAELCLSLELDGIVAVNTTVDRAVLQSAAARAAQNPGGISGAPLKGRAVDILRRLRTHVGDRLVLISVGGIETADDAWDRFEAGATLVQGHTGFVYGGPLWARRLNKELARRLREAGVSSVYELVGLYEGGGRGSGMANGAAGSSPQESALARNGETRPLGVGVPGAR